MMIDLPGFARTPCARNMLFDEGRVLSGNLSGGCTPTGRPIGAGVASDGSRLEHPA